MKKIITIVSLVFMAGFVLNLQAGDFKLDQSKVDQLFAEAHPATCLSTEFTAMNSLPNLNMTLDEKDPVLALVLATVLGPLGVHRLYLGTEPLVFVLYLITGGGCGIVALVDWIQLLLVMIDDKPLTPFIDNPNFIMWKDRM